VFYLGNFLNVLSSKFDRFTNFKLIDYMYVNSFHGKNYNVPFGFIITVVLFSLFSFKYVCNKEEI